MTAHTQLLVYNSENRFVGFFYKFTCRVERTKGLKDKTEFWDTIILHSPELVVRPALLVNLFAGFLLTASSQLFNLVISISIFIIFIIVLFSIIMVWEVPHQY